MGLERTIRTIERDEADTFLRLLCRCFDLDVARARDVFFSEPFYDLSRKWALFEGRQMVSILTITPLKFGWGPAIGIAGVATDPARRGLGLGRSLLVEALRDADARNEGAALLFAHRQELYRSVGFVELDRVLRGTVTGGRASDLEPIEPGEARTIYDAWSGADRARLVRDDRRWTFWNWVRRTCERVPDGYVVHESGLVRELVTSEVETPPIPNGSSWCGLGSMTERLGLRLRDVDDELILMGRDFPGVPQMFMTDQF